MPTAGEWYDAVWRAVRGDSGALEPLADPGVYEGILSHLESRGVKGLVARFYAAVIAGARGLVGQLVSLNPEDPGDCELALTAAGEAARLASMLARDVAQEHALYKPPEWATRAARAALEALKCVARSIEEQCRALGIA